VGCRSFLIIATSLSSSSAALLQSANRQPNRFQVIAARTPGLTSTDQAMAMEDLALLTGGRPLLKAAGQRLDGVQAEDLGGARRAWADLTHAGIVGGRGDPRALRAHLVCLRSAFRRTGDRELREKLRARIGKLMGGSATLWVGGSTEKEVEVRRELAERTAGALRGILREGMVPGGGASLLACRPALYERLESSASAEERAAYQILIRAMEAPTRAIANNAGHESSQVVARIGEGGNGHGFDARAGKVVDMAEAGIWDSAAVLKAAVHSAVSAAALALTTDVLIHHKKPARCTEP
jgi:chaperonin GroEL